MGEIIKDMPDPEQPQNSRSTGSLAAGIIERILSSRAPVMIAARYMLAGCIALLGLASLRFSALSLLPPEVYRKDCMQEYLLAKALLNGVEPYLFLSELAEKFLGDLPYPMLMHPTPHPPPTAVLSIPLGLLTYQQAAILWFVAEALCIVVAARVFLRWLGKRATIPWVLFLALALTSWTPFWEDLVFGQLTIFLLVPLLEAWLALGAGQNVKGGLLLGCVMSIKLMAWPVIIFLAWKRNWRAAGAAAAVVAAANLVATLVMGLDTMLYYYQKVGLGIMNLYRAQYGNLTTWTFGWRLFWGTDSERFVTVRVPPLIAAPSIAPLASYVIVLAILVSGLVLAIRARSFDAAFGVLICVSILINPVVWSQYLVLASIPIAIALRRLFVLGLPNKQTLAALALAGLLLARRTDIDRLITQFATETPGGGAPTVPFFIGQLALIPVLSILALMWFVWWVDRTQPPLPSMSDGDPSKS